MGREAGVAAPTGGFAALLRRHRLAAGLSQEALAERAGLSVRGVSDLERGARTAPRAETLRLLADALDLAQAERATLAAAARPGLVTPLLAPPPPPALGFPATPAFLSPPTALPRRRLPTPPTVLVGREEAVAAIVARLGAPGARLVTLTGPGGVGKTRLALASAEAMAPDFADGVALVELAPVRDPGLVASAIGRALGLREAGERSVAEVIAAYLADRELLLVLDNLEHVRAAAPLVAELLAAAPRLRVLATSRVRLRLRGEREQPVPPLTPPARTRASGPPPSVAEVAASPAVRLFVERATDADPGFALVAGNAAAVAAICRRLDGLPLAIELAAAWVKVLRPAALLERLARRAVSLAGGAHDLPSRHQTMRDAIAWSHDLLTPGEQTLFRRLAVFAGGFALVAAEAVTGWAGEEAAERDDAGVPAPPPQPLSSPGFDPRPSATSQLERLASLVDQSLVRAEPSPEGGEVDGEGRFRLLEPIRHYALERLTEAGEEVAVRRRHAAFFLELAERGEEGLTGPDQAAWMLRLEAEHDNLRGALGWSLDQGAVEHALRIGAALWQFWAASGRLNEGRDWLEWALQQGDEAAPQVRAKALMRLGSLAVDLADYPGARERFEESLAIWRGLGHESEAHVLNNLGLVAWCQGRYDEARSTELAALDHWQALGNSSGVARTLHVLGNVAVAQGDVAQALAHHESALRLRQENSDTRGVAYSLYWLSGLALLQGQEHEAHQLLRQSMALFEEVGDRFGIGFALDGFGRLASVRGNPREATGYFRDAIAVRREIGDRQGLVDCLEGIAMLAIQAGRAEVGVALLAAAAIWRDAHGAVLSPPWQTPVDDALRLGAARLKPERFQADLAEGRSLTIDQALEIATGADLR